MSAASLLAPVADRLRDSRRLRRVIRPTWWRLVPITPRSRWEGADRGTPIDVFYARRFLDDHRADIRGRVLVDAGPVGLPPGAATEVDVIDVNEYNSDASVLADLADAGSLPASTYDVAVLLGAVRFAADVEAALANAWTSLAPGGTLLVAVPSVARLRRGWEHLDAWRVTPTGLRRALAAACPGGTVSVAGHGNFATAVAFLAGVAAEELGARERSRDDPAFPVLACGVARKAAA